MALQTLSESVYVGMCLKIGTPQQVSNRREVTDIYELLLHKVAKTDQYNFMESGSKREGFRYRLHALAN